DDENVTSVVVDKASTSASCTSRECEGARATLPTPSSTENAADPPVTDHAPPSSAEPQPFDSERSKSSSATTTSSAGSSGAASTVTDWVTVSVAPSESVTVSDTSYVPASAYSCEAVTPSAT